MKNSSVLLVGCGDLGMRVGGILLARQWRVDAVRRTADRLPAGFGAHAADYTRPGGLGFIESLAPAFVIATFSPLDRSVEGYRRGFERGMAHLLSGLGGHRPRLVVMASSTRVFAEREGGWVDEGSPLTTDDPPAGAIIAAEEALLDSGLAATVVRFAGLYGSPGGRLLSRVGRGELCPPEPVRYTNRMHREDAAGFLVHLLDRAQAVVVPAPVYIGVDNAPAPRFEVESWLARQLGVDSSAERPGDGANEAGGRGAAGHRRCRNDALRASGYQLIYPDYRAGYRAVLGQGSSG